MAQACAKAGISVQTEYSVYIYHLPENQHEGQNDWEKRRVTADLNAAMREARMLYRSRGYRKVEVKQRLKDPRTRLMRDHTLKVFGLESGGLASRFACGIWPVGLAVFFCAAAVWALQVLF